jgi:hypothetical protein
MSTAAAVEHVFAMMAATYGAAWDRAIGTAPVNDVKTVWADALEDFVHSDDAKRAVMWALKNLPDTVPNSRQFRSLCQKSPAKVVPMLPVPVVNPEIAAKVLSNLRVDVQKHDFRSWAKAIIRDQKGGLPMNPTKLRMARDAMGEAA